jgi:hypothetical protein
MKIQKDGNQYCVKADNFINLQESKDYFFISEKEYREFENKYNHIYNDTQQLKQILMMNKDAFSGMYDYDGIAKNIIKLVDPSYL